MTVFLQDGDTEAVECADVACVVIICQLVDPFLHLGCCFIGKCYTENIAWTDAKFID